MFLNLSRNSKLKRIGRGLRHLRRGTAPERIRLAYFQYNERKRLAWWQSQIGKRHGLEIVLQPGVRMQLNLDSMLSQAIYCSAFEMNERRFLNAFLRPGDVFVDVGANIGLYTLIAAHIVGGSGRVYAFEPCSETYQRLLSNVHLNQITNVACHELALSDSTANLNLNVSQDGYDAWNSLAKPIAGSSFASKTIETVKLDTFVEENNLAGRLTMIKIDVEGWEGRVLEGGFKTLSQLDAPILQVEFTEQAARTAGSSCEKLYRDLAQLGYRMFTYDPKSRCLIDEPIREYFPHLNLIAAKQPEKVCSRLRARSKSPWYRLGGTGLPRRGFEI